MSDHAEGCVEYVHKLRRVQQIEIDASSKFLNEKEMRFLSRQKKTPGRDERDYNTELRWRAYPDVHAVGEVEEVRRREGREGREGE